MNLPLCIADLYRSGVKDDKLALLYDINQTNYVAVKTAVGLTERTVLHENILQGDVMGPLMASNHIDSVGRECLEENKHLYSYRDRVSIPPLTMVDDAISVVECGYQTDKMVAYLNSQSSLKYLQYGVDKCFKIHVGLYKEKYKCTPIYLDGWKAQEVKCLTTGQVKLNEVMIGKQNICETDSERYLGDQISATGTNQQTVKKRCDKSIGIIGKIKTMLEDMCFGKYTFVVGKLLTDSLFIGSVLCNSEVWYNVSVSEINKLEQCHESLIRTILGVGPKAPKHLLYLISGTAPVC